MPAADFCSCDDFYYNIMDRKAHLCYHLIAQKLAEATDRFDLFEDDDQFYDILIREWKTTEEQPRKKKTEDSDDTV